MRFVFSTFGSLGDLHPYIAVARVLTERGHQAVIGASEEYRETVGSAEIEFSAVRPSVSELGDIQTLLGEALDVRRGPEYLFRRMVMPHVRAAYDDLMRAAQGADLLISHPLSVTIPLVAEKRGIPWAGTVLAPMSFMSCYDPPLIAAAPWLKRVRTLGPGAYGLLFALLKRTVWHWETPLRRLRKELGLPRQKSMAIFEGQFSPFCNLALFDQQLAAPQPDWPTNLRICGAPVYDGAEERLPGHLEEFLAGGEPPIIFALGSSAVWMAGDFWDKAAAAAFRLGKRAVLITGPALPADLPEGTCAFPYLPFSEIFPRGSAIVHSAGIGTLARALRGGKPQLCVPVAFDQFDNAQRAARLGVARVLPFSKITVDLLVAHLTELLAKEDYARQGAQVASVLKETDGAERAAEELEGCVQERR
jgi:rhamnosyltransferase subunit B